VSVDEQIVNELRAGAESLAAYRSVVLGWPESDSTRDRLRGVADVLALYLLDVRRLLIPSLAARDDQSTTPARVAPSSASLADRINDTDRVLAEWLMAHPLSVEGPNGTSRDPVHRLVCHIGAVLKGLPGDATGDSERACGHLEAMLTRPLALLRAEISLAISYISAMPRGGDGSIDAH
jgi:hypothetical protein